jgi:hypothetical protein
MCRDPRASVSAQSVAQPWHYVVDEGVKDALSRQTIVDRVLAVFPGVTRPQIDGRISRRRQLTRLQDNLAVADWESRVERAKEDLAVKADVYDWLRPVELPAPDRPRVTGKPNPYTLVIGDMHFPTHDERTLSIFLQTVAALKPRRVILNGDTVDLLAVSKYPKDARARFTWKLRDEVAAFHSFLRDLHGLGDAWNLEVVETTANHSGSGTASRWWRYLSDRCPELLGHDEAEERLSYEAWFFPKWSSIRIVPSLVIADDLLVIHGDMARANGGYSARGHAEKWQSSTLNNHTHRSGSSIRRLPAVGSRPEGIRRAYEIGCACDLSPVYSSAPDWANGFAVISHDEPAGLYGVELVQVVGGRASVAALGSSLAA